MHSDVDEEQIELGMSHLPESHHSLQVRLESKEHSRGRGRATQGRVKEGMVYTAFIDIYEEIITSIPRLDLYYTLFVDKICVQAKVSPQSERVPLVLIIHLLHSRIGTAL